MDQHFNVCGLPQQLHSDNGKVFVNKLGRETFFRVQDPAHYYSPNNPSSNLMERFYWTLTAMLQTRGPGVQDNWDLWLKASVFAYNTTVLHSLLSSGWVI